MNSLRSISPLLTSLIGNGTDASGASDALGASDEAGAFAQILQATIAQGGEKADNANLGLLLASMIQNGGESDSSMMLLLAALSSQQQARGTSGTHASTGDASNVRSTGQNAPSGESKSLAANRYAQNAYATSAVPTFSGNTKAAQAYRSVIERFDVENNRRYTVNKQGKGDTYCNLFVTDVTAAMRAEVPHFVDKDTGEPRTGKGPGVIELSANDMNNWLHRYGERYGWHRTTPEMAQAYANAGRPAITSWKNPSGHGHIQVVSPSADGNYNTERGVAIAQAGRRLINYGYIDQIFGASSRKNVEYYVHD